MADKINPELKLAVLKELAKELAKELQYGFFTVSHVMGHIYNLIEDIEDTLNKPTKHEVK